MIRFFRSLAPNYVPANNTDNDGLYLLRERILQSVLLYGIALGTVTLVFLAFTGIANRQWAIIIPLILMILIFLILAASRYISFKIRAYILVSIIYLAGVWILLRTGLGGGLGGFFLFTTTILAAILIGEIIAGVSILVNIVTLVLIGIGMSSSFIQLPPYTDFMGNSSVSRNWIIYIATVFVLLVVSGAAIIVLSYGVKSILSSQAKLTGELVEERASLENRVAERTDNLQRRLTQIRTAAAISRSISSVLDPQSLLQNVVDLVRKEMNLYYVGVFLVDDTHQNAVLHSATGDTGQKMVADGHHLPIGGTSMIGRTIALKVPLIALDVGEEPVRFNNPNLPLTRSEMALPLISRENVLGAMTIQSVEPEAFDEDDILVLQGVADSVATALENSRLYQQSQENLAEISALNRVFIQQQWSEAVINLKDDFYTYESPSPVNQNDSGHQTQIPIVLRDQVLGQFIIDADTSSFTSDDIAFVEAISSQTAYALENARLLNESQRRALQEQRVNEASAAFAKSMNVEEILREAVRELGHLSSVSEVSIRLIPAEDPIIENHFAGNNVRKNERNG
jgi:GAF domain-containing protein